MLTPTTATNTGAGPNDDMPSNSDSGAGEGDYDGTLKGRLKDFVIGGYEGSLTEKVANYAIESTRIHGLFNLSIKSWLIWGTAAGVTSVAGTKLYRKIKRKRPDVISRTFSWIATSLKETFMSWIGLGETVPEDPWASHNSTGLQGAAWPLGGPFRQNAVPTGQTPAAPLPQNTQPLAYTTPSPQTQAPPTDS